jgi:DNA polymerase elongation subunit (family B)
MNINHKHNIEDSKNHTNHQKARNVEKMKLKVTIKLQNYMIPLTHQSYLLVHSLYDEK